MSTTPDPEQAAQTARQLLDARVSVVRKLATAAAEAEQAQATAEAAERQFVAVYREATQAGWAEAELRKMGIPAPKRRAPGRPRKQSGSKPRDHNDSDGHQD